MISFDRYALEKAIDERIEDAFDFGSVYGKELFDEESNNVPMKKIKTLFVLKYLNAANLYKKIYFYQF